MLLINAQCEINNPQGINVSFRAESWGAGS